MPIQQTKKQTDLEKRLRLLRQQVYGKTPEHQTINIPDAQNLQDSSKFSGASRSDVTYLYQDLFKIGVLTTLAIGVQIILFILLKNHVLNLNFF